jgi:membrane-associated phospholipid phosphatase
VSAQTQGSAQTPDTGAPAAPTDNKVTTGPGGLLLDIKDYYTAPLRWDVRDWAYFAGALGLIAGAHHYDTQVRDHYVKDPTAPLGTKNSKELQDALPGVAALVGTWAFANLIDDDDGRREVWGMLEAAGLSTVTSYGLKYAAGRERPDETTDPDKWRAGGSSFPSIHVAAATAIGTVLAESGNDDYRWARRFLGYGLAGLTGYERLKHNAHWFSDVVAGAALGGATAHFVLQRSLRSNGESASASFMVVPVEGGAMLTYNRTLR